VEISRCTWTTLTIAIETASMHVTQHGYGADSRNRQEHHHGYSSHQRNNMFVSARIHE